MVTRPTSGRVRESVLNALASLGVIEDAVVLDLFAGTGALGVEAVSRGARSLTLVEQDAEAVECIEYSIADFGLDDRAEVVRAEVLTWCERTRPLADLVFADPPYDFSEWDRLLVSLSADFVVAEAGRQVDPPAGWEIVRSRSYGAAHVTFLAPLPAESAP